MKNRLMARLRRQRAQLVADLKELWVVVLMIFGLVVLAIWLDTTRVTPMEALVTVAVLVPACALVLGVESKVRNRNPD